MNGDIIFYIKYGLTILGLVIAVSRLFYMQHRKAREDAREHDELIKWRTEMSKDVEYLKGKVFNDQS